MGTGIAVSNATELAQRIRRLREVLDGWLADLEAGGPDAGRGCGPRRPARRAGEGRALEDVHSS